MENKELAKALGQRFIQRRETKAKQFNDGHYEPIHERWTLQDIVDHIEGKKTWGHYLVDDENNCRIAAFDIDLKSKSLWKNDDGLLVEIEPRSVWLSEESFTKLDLQIQLRCMAEGLALRARRRTSLDVGVAYSGNKGVHVYIFFPSPIPAVAARTAAEDILESFGCFERIRGEHLWAHSSSYHSLEIEVFPKQDTIREGGLGNLMRLPLGINLKSGQSSFFVNLNAPYNSLDIDAADEVLTSGGSLRGQE